MLLGTLAAALFAASFANPPTEYLRAGVALAAADEGRREAERQFDLAFHEHGLEPALDSRDRCERALRSVLGAVDIHHVARERQIAARERFRAALGRWQQAISP